MADVRTQAAPPPGWAAAAMTRPWRYLVAVVVFVNGFAHLAGTTEALGAADDGTSLDYLGGAWVVSDPTMLRVAAAAWALLAALFALCAIAIWIADPRWRVTTIGVASVSVLACLVGLWATVTGVVVGSAILVLAIAAPAQQGNDR